MAQEPICPLAFLLMNSQVADSPFQDVAHPKRRAFLTALIQAGGNVTRAADLVGVARETPYSDPWQHDAAFQAGLTKAKRIAAEALEAEAIRRAYEGTERPAGWYKGKPGGMITEYSDTLAIFLLKGLMPEKYSEKVEVRGALAGIELDRLPHEAIARIAAGEHPGAVVASLAETGITALLEAGEGEPAEDDQSETRSAGPDQQLDQPNPE